MSCKKTFVFLLCIGIILLCFSLPGCSSKPKVTPDGYMELVAMSGNTNMESKEFTITVEDNRFKFKTTENNQDGLRGQVVKMQGAVETVASSFSVGANPEEDTWPFNLEPGEYKIRVESTGTKFEIRMEEKAPQK